jgi:Na+-translocating ferredoxin:NAD+ oxidoreductase RnfG subunit
MSEVQKLIAAVVFVFVAGFVMVAANKQQSKEEKESASAIRSLVAMQEMATQKCPKLILKETGTQVYFPAKTDSDKATYVTMEWIGESDSKFKTASCTLHMALGGISRLVIDDKVIIDKKVN